MCFCSLTFSFTNSFWSQRFCSYSFFIGIDRCFSTILLQPHIRQTAAFFKWNMRRRLLIIRGTKFWCHCLVNRCNSTAIAVRCKDGVVIGVEKLILSKMLVAGSNRKIYSVDTHAGAVWMFVFPVLILCRPSQVYRLMVDKLSTKHDQKHVHTKRPTVTPSHAKCWMSDLASMS